MIEKIVLDHLSTELTGTAVRYEVSANPPEKLVVIEKTGSGLENHILRATFALQSYADSLWETMQLNELVKQAMSSLIEHPNVSKVRLNGDYNFTDTSTKKHRYQAVFEIVYME